VFASVLKFDISFKLLIMWFNLYVNNHSIAFERN